MYNFETVDKWVLGLYSVNSSVSELIGGCRYGRRITAGMDFFDNACS